MLLFPLSLRQSKENRDEESEFTFVPKPDLSSPPSFSFCVYKNTMCENFKIRLFRLLTCVKKGKVSLPPWENLFLLGGGTTRESYVAPHDVCALPPSPFLFGMQRRSSSVQKS